MKWWLCLLLCCCVVGVLQAQQQNTWYLSNGGNDALFPNCRTPQNPCATFSVVINYLQQQPRSAVESTTVFVNSGAYDFVFSGNITVPFSIRGLNPLSKSSITVRSSIQFSRQNLVFEHVNFIYVCQTQNCFSQTFLFTNTSSIQFINCEWMGWKTNPWVFQSLDQLIITSAIFSFNIRPISIDSVKQVVLDSIYAYSNQQQLFVVTNVNSLQVTNSMLTFNYGFIFNVNSVPSFTIRSTLFYSNIGATTQMLVALFNVPQLQLFQVKFDGNMFYNYLINQNPEGVKNVSIALDQISTTKHHNTMCNLFYFSSTSASADVSYSSFDLQISNSTFDEENSINSMCELFSIVWATKLTKGRIYETRNKFWNKNTYAFDVFCVPGQQFNVLISNQSNYVTTQVPWIVGEDCIACQDCGLTSSSTSTYSPFVKVMPKENAYSLYNVASTTSFVWFTFLYVACFLMHICLAIFDAMFRPNIVFAICFYIIMYIRVLSPFLASFIEGLIFSQPMFAGGTLLFIPFLFAFGDVINIAVMFICQILMVCRAKLKKDPIKKESNVIHFISGLLQIITWIVFVACVFLNHLYITTKDGLEISLIVVNVYILICALGYFVHLLLFCVDCRDYYTKKRRHLDIMKLKLLNFVDEETQLITSKKQHYQTIQNFEIPFEQIVNLEQIGVGASGIVFKANWKQETVALKLFKASAVQGGSTGSSSRNTEFEHEIEILTSLSHPNIVNLFGYVNQAPRIGLVLEFCKFGSLHNWISTKEELPWIEKLKWILQIAKGMRFLHNRQIIHRDLKAENILISEQGLKIADFGFAKTQQAIAQNMTQRIGTCYFIAPEVINSTTYNQSCDVFSFAIICYQVFYWTTDPYHSSGMKIGIELLVAKDANFRPKINQQQIDTASTVDAQATSMFEMMKNCWRHNPDERPSFADVCQEIEDHLDCWTQQQQRTKLT